MNGEVIRKWESAKQAGITLGIAPTNITRCCKGKINSIKGYKWEYVKEGE